MKKKLLAMFLAVSMALSLCACGNNDSGTNTTYEENPAVSDNFLPNDAGGLAGDEADESVGAITDGGDEVGAFEQEEIGGATTESATTPKGLIVMTAVAGAGIDQYVTISCVSPDTGITQDVAQFPFGYDDTTLYCTANSLDASFGQGYYATRREWFDSDYDRMAISRLDTASGEMHAGWIDASGEFFDVTQALGFEATSDFDEATRHYAVGFSENGEFIYGCLVSEGRGFRREFYHVPLDNLNAAMVEAGISLPGVGENFCDGKSLRFSDWNNVSGEFLLNTIDKVSYLCDDAAGANQRLYVPGNSRLSWNGVFSPDGRLVAFMSTPKNGGTVDIYTMSLVDGNPLKVLTEFAFADQFGCESGVYTFGEPCSMLIGWE